jgi:hypothetical protein
MNAMTGLLNKAIRKEARRKNQDKTLQTALELLNRRIQTMEIQLQEGRGDYSETDIEDYNLSARFLNLHYNKIYKFFI